MNFYWAERLMFNIKRNLKAFHRVDYCNEILSMSVLIILSPSTTFWKLANQNVIEFFPFCVCYSGCGFRFLKYEATNSKWLETKDIFIIKMWFSPSSDFLNTSYEDLYFTKKWMKLSPILHEYIHRMCVHLMQWKWLKLDHLISATCISAKGDTLACTSPYE